jgi:hypothetical protein
MADKEQTKKEYSTHIYALDLKKIYKAYESQYQSEIQQPRFESLNTFINSYCDHENIQYENNLAIDVLPNQKVKDSIDVYLKFVELYLCVIDKKIISNFLDYQLKQFKNKNAKIKFIASINNKVIPSLNVESNHEGFLRMDEIKKWQEKNELKYKAKSKAPVTKRFKAQKLNWPLIAKISNGLFERNITSNKTDFKKLINSGSSIYIEQKKMLLFALIIKLMYNKYKLLEVEGFKKGAYFSVLSLMIKPNNGKGFSAKYIHNLILRIKKKNPNQIINAEIEANQFILTYCPELDKPKSKKQDR